MPKDKEPKTLIEDLLNKLEAMLDCGALTLAAVAVHILPDKAPEAGATRVCEWLRSRSRTPNGEAALRMHSLATEKTVDIAADAKLAKEYRKAFKAITSKRRDG